MSKKAKLTEEQINKLLVPIEYHANDFPGAFVATIFGTDHKSKFGSYSIGCQLDHDDPLFEVDSGHVSPDDSHQAALVAAVQGIVVRAPAKAKIELRTTNEYISLTINEYLTVWEANGWLTNQMERPEHVEDWKKIDATIKAKSLEVVANLIPFDLVEKDQVLSFLEMLATSERDKFIKSAS